MKQQEEYYLEYNRGQHIADQKRQADKKEIFNKLVEGLKAFDITIEDKDKFKLEPLTYIQKKYVSLHKKTFPTLNFQQLANVLLHDFTNITMLVGAYSTIGLDEDKELERQYYCTYATTEAQKERLRRCKNLIQALEDMYQAEKGSMFTRFISSSDLSRFLQIDTSNGNLKPRTHYVLNGGTI